MSSSVRARNGKQSQPATVHPTTTTKSRPKTSISWILIDILRILGGLALLSSTLSYFITGNYFWVEGNPLWMNRSWVQHKLLGDISLTPAELKTYDGTDASKPIYIALNGTIYDVSASAHFYGPGGGYHAFAGVDAMRAFVTGCFAEDRTDDMRGAEDIYMPVDLDDPPAVVPGESDAEAKEKRRIWKNRKQQARKQALEKVKQGVEGWKESFEGTKGMYGGGKTKYFRVGKIRFTEKDLKERAERKQPVLCKRALNMRPKKAEDLGIL